VIVNDLTTMSIHTNAINLYSKGYRNIVYVYYWTF
jgi:hypothetical protein